MRSVSSRPYRANIEVRLRILALPSVRALNDKLQDHGPRNRKRIARRRSDYQDLVPLVRDSNILAAGFNDL